MTDERKGMTVGQLRVALAPLPDDMPVVVVYDTGYGHGEKPSVHVEDIDWLASTSVSVLVIDAESDYL